MKIKLELQTLLSNIDGNSLSKGNFILVIHPGKHRKLMLSLPGSKTMQVGGQKVQLMMMPLFKEFNF